MNISHNALRPARPPARDLANLTASSASGPTESGIWSATFRPQWLVQGITLRLIQADTRGQLFTDSSGRGEPVNQLVFWEETHGRSHRGRPGAHLAPGVSPGRGPGGS